ncbi:MAG: hypothetical protein JNL69_08765 [Bacteroidia bacterium]|nr:hypothetical protein [Bacteroidia bacterium]
MKKTLYILSILLFVFNSCKKENSPQKINCGSSNLISYITSQDLIKCKYITGSYWVYVDSVSLQYDSVYISNYSQGFMEENVCKNKYEHHSFQTVSFTTNNTKDYAVVAGGLFKNVNGFNTGTKIYNEYSSANSYTNFIINRLDSMYVYDQYYYNVLKATIDNDASEQNRKSIYYINSDFGFLRHEIYQNSALILNKILIRKNILR